MSDNRWNRILRSIASSPKRVKEIKENILLYKKIGYHRSANVLEQLLNNAKEQL